MAGTLAPKPRWTKPKPKNIDEMPLIMSLSDLSLLTGKSVNTLRKYCSEAVIPAKKIGNDWFIHRDKFLSMF